MPKKQPKIYTNKQYIDTIFGRKSNKLPGMKLINARLNSNPVIQQGLKMQSGKEYLAMIMATHGDSEIRNLRRSHLTDSGKSYTMKRWAIWAVSI